MQSLAASLRVGFAMSGKEPQVAARETTTMEDVIENDKGPTLNSKRANSGKHCGKKAAAQKKWRGI
jgi:hypothetical protein